MALPDKKHIVIGITGGIAAYKALSLIRLFKQAEYDVRVVATKNALEFVTPLTIETLSQNSLYHEMFGPSPKRSVDHIAIADWADAVVIAPASANIIGKYAHGIADDPLSTLLLAVKAPVFVAPAMNCNMYSHPAVQANLTVLQERGVHIVEPQGGFLACGYEGKGRLEDPEQIFKVVDQYLNQELSLQGVQAVVTAGPTYESIDPVRFIGNHSSGLMGFELAQVLVEMGAQVTPVTGPTRLTVTHPSIERVDVVSAQQMYETVMAKSQAAKLIIMAAAVADYTPVTVADQKIKKDQQEFQLLLRKTKDILWELGQNKRNDQCLVGFALETENEIENAQKKLQNKKCDWIVLNSMNHPQAGFNKPTNKVMMISKENQIVETEVLSKKEIAAEIVRTVVNSLKIN